MIDKLLALAAVEHRQALVEPAVVDLGEVLEAVREDVATRLHQAGVTLRVPGSAPAVRGDAFLLRQAIGNLVENAIDFSPAGGAVSVAASVAGGEVVLQVADRGPGIPDYAMPRVFERFYSLPRPRGGSRSSGIGLCFVAEVASLHGGRVALEPREGGGTLARLALPVA